MPKYYVMLINTESYQMITPVKALLNPYNGGQAYCAGMPQFFGGTDDKDQPVALVLADEINQESRQTLELTSGSPHYFFTEENMFFYCATEGQWDHTGTPWGPAQTANEAEMDRLVTVDLKQFTNNMSDDVIIDNLINQTTHGTVVPQKGRDDFALSSTRTAFITLIRRYLDGAL